MKRVLICFLLFIIITYPVRVFAYDCTSVPTAQKVLLKLSDIQDSILLFLLMDPRKQIPYRLARADSLYQRSEKASDKNLAYTYALRGEDHMTRLVSIMRTMTNTRSLDIRGMEQSVKSHEKIVTNEKSSCDWQTVKTFIQSNHNIMQQLYYLRLPTDTNMLLLKGTRQL